MKPIEQHVRRAFSFVVGYFCHDLLLGAQRNGQGAGCKENMIDSPHASRNARTFDFRAALDPRPDFAGSFCVSNKFVTLSKAGYVRIVRQPLNSCHANRAPLTVTNTRVQDCPNSNCDTFAQIETVLRHFVSEYFGFSAPSHGSWTFADGLARSRSLAIAVASTALTKTWKEAVLKLIELAVFLVYFVERFVVQFAAATGIDLMREQPDFFRDKSVEGLNQRAVLRSTAAMFHIRWFKCWKFDRAVNERSAWCRRGQFGNRLRADHLMSCAIHYLPPRTQIPVGIWHIF